MSRSVLTEDAKDTNFIKINEWRVENFNHAEGVI
jgi:hypothetical protein